MNDKAKTLDNVRYWLHCGDRYHSELCKILGLETTSGTKPIVEAIINLFPSSSARSAHSADCGWWSPTLNGNVWDGVCTCGYGRHYSRNNDGDESQLVNEKYRKRDSERVQLLRLVEELAEKLGGKPAISNYNDNHIDIWVWKDSFTKLWRSNDLRTLPQAISAVEAKLAELDQPDKHDLPNQPGKWKWQCSEAAKAEMHEVFLLGGRLMTHDDNGHVRDVKFVHGNEGQWQRCGEQVNTVGQTCAARLHKFASKLEDEAK